MRCFTQQSKGFVQPALFSGTGNAYLYVMDTQATDNLIVSRPRGPANFDLQSEFSPAGDQPAAIAELIDGIKNGERDQVLLGVTGSGKT